MSAAVNLFNILSIYWLFSLNMHFVQNINSYVYTVEANHNKGAKQKAEIQIEKK